MKTRTLLLLAVSCGLVILIAGGIQLLRVSGQTNSTTTLAVDQQGSAGDVSVTLLGVHDDTTTIRATMQLAGVADPAGTQGFTLVAPDSVVAPDPTAPGACQAITVAAQTCDLVFPVAGLKGDVRQLLFHRAEDQLRWCLAGCNE
ncbi:MAG: hypothetical protein ABIQ39_02785 [Ilumatobacteraceae bacterium]